MCGAVFGRIGTSREGQRDRFAPASTSSQPHDSGCLCGIDLGAAEVKIVVCDAEGARARLGACQEPSSKPSTSAQRFFGSGYSRRLDVGLSDYAL